MVVYGQSQIHSVYIQEEIFQTDNKREKKKQKQNTFRKCSHRDFLYGTDGTSHYYDI